VDQYLYDQPLWALSLTRPAIALYTVVVDQDSVGDGQQRSVILTLCGDTVPSVGDFALGRCSFYSRLGLVCPLGECGVGVLSVQVHCLDVDVQS
jgi:hypothetical protein